MRFATAVLWLLSITLAASSLTAAGQERASSTPGDAPVAAPKPNGPDAGHPPLLRADSELRIFVDAQNIHTTATIKYTLLRGAVDRVRFAVPGSERLLAVTLNGSTPACETAADGGFTTVTVRLPSRIRDSVSLEIQTQRPHSGNRVDLGGEGEDQFIQPLDVLQSQGVILLACDPAFDVLIDRTRGLVETAAPSSPNGSAEGRSRCFRFYGPRLRLLAALLPAGPPVHTQQDARYTFHESELRLHADLTYEATGNGLFELRLEVPEAFVLEEVRVDGKSAVYRSDERVLALSFARARQKVHVSVRGRCSWQSAPEQPLPLVRPVDASGTGTIAIGAPVGFDVRLTGAGLSPLDSTMLSPAGATSDSLVTRVWRFQTAPGSLQVHVARAQPRVSADLESDVRIALDRAAVSTTLKYDVHEAGTRVFHFALPERAENVRIDELGGTARILQRTQGEADHPGWTAWTLRMNRDVLGPQKFRVNWSVPLERERGSGEAARRLSLSPLRVLASSDTAEVLDEASGRITVRDARPLGLSVHTTTGTLTRETADGGSIVFGHDNDPAELQINVSPGKPVPASTLVSRALIEIRPAPAGPADYECRYQFQSPSGRLPIQLPAGAEPLSVSFDGAPVPLLRGSEDGAVGDYDTYEIDLSRIEPSAVQSLLLIRFRAPLEGSSLTRRRGSLAALLPLLGELDGSLIAVAETRTCVWLPEHLAVTGTPRGFARSDRDHHWTEELRAASASGVLPHVFQSYGRPEVISLSCWDRTFATWLLGGAAFVAALVLLPTTGENRVTMVLTGAVVLTLLSLVHPHAVAQGLFAARWGLAAAAILWTTAAARTRLSQNGTSSDTNGPVAAVISPVESRLEPLRKGA